MAKRGIRTLNLPSIEYSQGDESLFRQTLTQIHIETNNDMLEVEKLKTKTSTLSLRRHQFLLMGASSG
tara:strand:- start:1532 stop:1735 length:204 start_codon:yes stop_codon:yes gene_type:complete